MAVNQSRPVPEVRLSVPAHGAFLSLIRTTSAAVAARLDLTIDEIEDLRIAVDEAAAILLPAATRPDAASANAASGDPVSDDSAASGNAAADNPAASGDPASDDGAASEAGVVDVVFTLDPAELTISLSADTGSAGAPDQSGFGWTVLSALAGSVTAEHHDGRTTIVLSHRRRALT